MAVFDPNEQRVVVRVVYDGAAGAGKTTNLRQLGSLFAAQRTTEVTSPVELRGRTLYFDWLQIAAGVVCGFPLMCQVISVPGQVAFTARRQHLLASADVVVYVCDSSGSAIGKARDALALIERSAQSVPARDFVLQANKQDQTNALDGKAILAALGRPDLAVLEAIAADGIGVVDTFVTAVRTVAKRIQLQAEREGLRIPVRPAESMGQVLAEVARTPIDRFGAAELLLEEASAAFLFQETAPAPAPAEPTASLEAPLPTADVPTGFIWPAHTGRAILRALAPEDATRETGPAGRHEWSIGDHLLTTSAAQRFVDADAARQALVRAARERTQLEGLLVLDTVLVVQAASDGASWLWTVAPRIGDVGAWLVDGDDRSRIDALGSAVGAAASVALRHGLAFTTGFAGFGVQNGTVRYGGDLAPSESAGAAAVRLLQNAVGELDRNNQDVESFVEAVERELARRLREAEAAFFLGGIGEARDPRLVRVLERLVRREGKPAADHVAA